MKKCIKCKGNKSIINYSKRKDSVDGHYHTCKECSKTIAKLNRAKRLKTFIGYITERVRDLNKASGRKTGKANDIIKNSTPITTIDIINLINKDCKCYYCGYKDDIKLLVFDHKIPLSRNGKHNIENICISCPECNNLKGTKTDVEFKKFIIEYIKRF